MSERAKHLFEFRSERIAKAANAEAQYHRERLVFWQSALDEATRVVEQTAGVEVRRIGRRIAVVHDDFRPPAAGHRDSRMGESARKIQEHQAAMDRFVSDAALYGTQDRVYELDADDVAHFRLNGRERPE